MESPSPPRRRTIQKNKPVIKRLLANKCERERVRKINEAFEVLKTHIPYCDSGRIRTKLDVLKFAIDYIQILTKMVSQNQAAMLLKASQMEGSRLGFGSEEVSSPNSTDMYYPEGSTAFLFNDRPTTLMGMQSPTMSEGEVFFGDNVPEEQMTTDFQWEQTRTHSCQQFYQPQPLRPQPPQRQEQIHMQQYQQQDQLHHLQEQQIRQLQQHEQQQQQQQQRQKEQEQRRRNQLQQQDSPLLQQDNSQQQQQPQHQQQQLPKPHKQQQPEQQPAQIPDQWEHDLWPMPLPPRSVMPVPEPPTQPDDMKDLNDDEENTGWILL